MRDSWRNSATCPRCRCRNRRPNAATGVAREMAGPAPCGGCGAKLGSGALSAVIAGLGGAARADTERLPGDDAAIIRLGGARQVISTDHLRAFAMDPALVARVAAVHALGDVWAMGAAPQSAVATVILPRLEPRLQGAWLEEVMGAAHAVFSRCRARVSRRAFVDGGGADGGVHGDGACSTARRSRCPVVMQVTR
jgi:selenophosphate synthase